MPTKRKTGPKPILPLKLGDECRKCKRTDVEFYEYSSRCKLCRSERAASYYKERYWSDPEWREKQIKDAGKRHQKTGFDTCQCGQPKQVEANLCKVCWETPTETCIRCGTPRDDNFVCNKCDSCVKRTQKEQRQKEKYKIKAREKLLYKKYGLTIDEYDQMIADQGNKCAVCRRDWNVKGPQVDHDHTMSGRESIRGILCFQCNINIGYFGDSVQGFTRVLEYLNKHESKRKA